MNKLFKTFIGFFLILGLSTSSFANGLSLNSVGTKALAMGGAFVGLADDGTAIYWNPAGLAGQKGSFSAYFTGVMPMGTYEYDLAMVDTETKSNLYPTGGLFAVYPMGDLTYGFGVFVPAGLGAEYPGADLAAFSGMQTFNWETQIGVVSISPAIAYQVNDQFSIGLSANIYYALFDLSRPDAADLNGDMIPETPVQYKEESTGIGYGVTLGLKYDINNQFAVGASFRTETPVTMDGTAEIVGILETDFERDVSWPMWITGGVAYKPQDELTLTFDLQYSKWSVLDKLTAKYDDLPDGIFVLEWDDALQVRFGAQYMVTPETALRFGYYYDPAPAPDKTLNILFPSSTNHAGSVGFAHDFGKYSVEGALEYVLGGDRDVDAFPNAMAPENMPGIHHTDIFAFTLGFAMEL